MYELADKLGQPLSVIMEMTVSEFDHWWTFFKLRQQRQEKQNGDVRRGTSPPPSR